MPSWEGQAGDDSPPRAGCLPTARVRSLGWIQIVALAGRRRDALAHPADTFPAAPFCIGRRARAAAARCSSATRRKSRRTGAASASCTAIRITSRCAGRRSAHARVPRAIRLRRRLRLQHRRRARRGERVLRPISRRGEQLTEPYQGAPSCALSAARSASAGFESTAVRQAMKPSGRINAAPRSPIP